MFLNRFKLKLGVNSVLLAIALTILLGDRISAELNLAIVRNVLAADDSNVRPKRDGIASSNINEIKLIKLPPPLFRKDAPKQVKNKNSPIALQLLSETPNQITDLEEWFINNKLALPLAYVEPNSYPTSRQTRQQLPTAIPQQFRNRELWRAINPVNSKLFLLVYGSSFQSDRVGGPYLLLYDEGENKFKYGYDFSNYVFAPEYEPADRDFIDQSINWAMHSGDRLYVSHSHNTYAKSSRGMNAYLTAINTINNRTVWNSKPLICNADNFEIINDVIICGYGFTAEPDFLYSIDKNTGEILQKIKLKSAPDYIIGKGDRLYVRTYNSDYVFKIVNQTDNKSTKYKQTIRAEFGQ